MKIRTAAMADLDALATVEAQCFPAAEAAEVRQTASLTLRFPVQAVQRQLQTTVL